MTNRHRDDGAGGASGDGTALDIKVSLAPRPTGQAAGRVIRQTAAVPHSPGASPNRPGSVPARV